MSEWGIESQTIVLFDSSEKGVRKLVIHSRQRLLTVRAG